MVEAAIFAPIVIFLIIGMIAGGIYFGDRVSVQWAARSGARAGSVGGNDGFSDYDILQEVQKALVVLPNANIDRVIVYHASDYGDPPSDTCRSGVAVTGKGIGDCNVFSVADFARPSSDFGAGGWYGDDSWLATKRVVTGYSGTDFLGVDIQARCTCGVQIFGGTGNIESNTVVRIEAKEV